MSEQKALTMPSEITLSSGRVVTVDVVCLEQGQLKTFPKDGKPFAPAEVIEHIYLIGHHAAMGGKKTQVNTSTTFIVEDMNRVEMAKYRDELNKVGKNIKTMHRWLLLDVFIMFSTVGLTVFQFCLGRIPWYFAATYLLTAFVVVPSFMLMCRDWKILRRVTNS